MIVLAALVKGKIAFNLEPPPPKFETHHTWAAHANSHSLIEFSVTGKSTFETTLIPHAALSTLDLFETPYSILDTSLLRFLRGAFLPSTHQVNLDILDNFETRHTFIRRNLKQIIKAYSDCKRRRPHSQLVPSKQFRPNQSNVETAADILWHCVLIKYLVILFSY
jgi:hypothetical protein